MEQSVDREPKEVHTKASAKPVLATKEQREDDKQKKNDKNLKASSGQQSRGLSELARQLRVLQAKNEKLTIDIGRLERQLRILSDTSGISVSDLRATLERACESEAYGELQHRLASLQAQLEEAKLKQRKANEFDREADAKKMANLQLRIGELEEAEGALRQEIAGLYQSQDEQAEDATKLKAANEVQAEEMLRLREQIANLESQNQKLLEEAKSQPPRVSPPDVTTTTAPPPTTAATSEKKSKTKDPPAHQSDKHTKNTATITPASPSKSPKTKSPSRVKKAPPSTTSTDNVSAPPLVAGSPTKSPSSSKTKKVAPPDAKATPPPLVSPTESSSPKRTKKAPAVSTKTPLVPNATAKKPPPSTTVATRKQQLDAESKHVKLLRNQVASREKELELKESQYKTRFALQEDRIVDMEQQLSSLYTAFELLDQEHTQEQRSRNELTQALQMADSQVAKAVDHLQRRNNPSPGGVTAMSPPAQTPVKVLGTPPSNNKTPATPSTTYSTATSNNGTPMVLPRTSPSAIMTTPPGATDAALSKQNDVMVASFVMKRGRLNRWKRKYVSLSRRFANFELKLSDGPNSQDSRKHKVSSHFLTVFRSGFETTKEFSSYPYCFRIKTDQYNREAPVLVLAVQTHEEFHQWLVGLQEAVQGSSAAPVVTDPMEKLPSPIRAAATSPSTPVATAAGGNGGRSTPLQDTDFEAALAESLRVSQEEASKKQVSPHRMNAPPPNKSTRQDSELEAVLAKSLQSSQEATTTPQSRRRVPPPRELTSEESKHEIRDSSERSDRDLEMEAALAESLRTTHDLSQVPTAKV